MEFQGKIRNVMPARSGLTQRGNEWKALPFVFEYKEVETDPYPDSVLLETLDTNIIAGIEACCQKDNTGKLVVQNGEYILTREIPVRIGFRHKAKVYVPKDGGQARFINEIRINDIKSVRLTQQPAPQPAPQMVQQAQTPFPPQVDANGNPIKDKDDDLPF